MNSKESLEIKRIKSAAELLKKLATEELSSIEVQKHLFQSSKILYALALRKVKTAKQRSRQVAEQQWSDQAQARRLSRNKEDGKPFRTGFPWCADEVKRIVNYFNTREKTLEDIAAAVQRSLFSVVLKLHQVGQLTDAELSYFNRKKSDFLEKDRLSVLAKTKSTAQ